MIGFGYEEEKVMSEDEIYNILQELDTWGSNRQPELSEVVRILREVPPKSIEIDSRSNYLYLIFNRVLALSEAVALMGFRADTVDVVNYGKTLRLWWD